MHLIIVGAGEVGWYLAERLGGEGNDVVVIEQNEEIAASIGEALDVQVVVGNATVPSTLRAARIERAEFPVHRTRMLNMEIPSSRPATAMSRSPS